MLKNRVLILCVLVFSLSIVTQVKSYTMANVQNKAVMSISSSENALIAIPEEIETNVSKSINNTITKTITDVGETEQTETNITTQFNEDNFYIKNNMNENIDVSIMLLDKGSGVTLDNNHDIVIRPGEEWDDLTYNFDNSIENQTVELLISAKWNGGYAEINKDLEIVVEESSYDKLNTINLLTPQLESENGVSADNNNLNQDTKSQTEVIGYSVDLTNPIDNNKNETTNLIEDQSEENISNNSANIESISETEN